MLPDPPYGVEVDLRDFPFMALDVRRLLSSETWILAADEPKIGHAAMSLWAECWHQVPAGSVANNDRVLAHLAMCTPEVWASIRDRVLAGWRLCSDGRYYHPTVAEKAKEAWDAKRARHERVMNATLHATEKRRIENERLQRIAEKRREKRLKKYGDSEGVRNGVRDGMQQCVRDGPYIDKDKDRDIKEENPPTPQTPKTVRKRLPRPEVPALLELAAPEPVLPAWLPPKAWEDLCAHRKRLKKPIDLESIPKIIATLDKLRQAGHDPTEVIDQSIANHWQGLFPVRPVTPAAEPAKKPNPTRGYV